MNQNAEKWVAALRSGEFKQTDGTLRDRMGFCCLGVACELYRRETGEGRWVFRPSVASHVFRVGPGESADDVLPPTVRDWLGLRDHRGGNNVANLTDMNDGGDSFEAIADVIVDQPGGLFA